MICRACREAADLARAILAAGGTAPMGSLFGSLGHEKCKDGTWCDCQHQLPLERARP